MKKRNYGFTLIELLVVMALFGFVLAGTTQMVVSMLTAHRQQSKIAETNIEGIVGLELLRQDLEKAGFGLPWNGLTNYTEANGGTAALLNDTCPNAPKAIVSLNDSAWKNTDYLTIRAVNVAANSSCNKWSFLSPGNVPIPNMWSSTTSTADNFTINDRVIILAPASPEATTSARRLVISTTGSYFAPWGNTSSLASTMTTTGIAYGVDVHDLVRPFNRADYYISQPSTMPQRCAPGTGILYKAVMQQDTTGSFPTAMPLLDCVADMEVFFLYDPNGSGSPSLTAINDISGWTAQAVRDQVKEVRVYILAHEGQRDLNFTYPTSSIPVGTEFGVNAGKNFSLTGIANWANYRWKVYSLVVKLDNLGS